MGKLFGGELLLQWGDSCATGDSDFAVYAGVLGGPYDEHNPVVCGTGGSPSANFTPQTGDRYYLVVPRNGVSEGSYGRDSAGVERPAARSGCATQSLDVCW